MDQVGITCIDLECMLYDESAEPKALPLSLLDEITNGFCEENVIGTGGFAVVYKAVLGNGMVAVKKLSNAYMQETVFLREVQCLMTVKHKNIVRFLGYCADTQGSMERFNNMFVMADIYQRLLCFEYVPNGSLHEHITDASRGLEWSTRYQIIKGICEGLNYLHENGILHLDMKPANILLDENMVPKITDFGLSRCFAEGKSWITATKPSGTLGYLAPEFDNLTLRRCYDIYSLGVIIVEMLTGKKGYRAIEAVLHSWRKRLDNSDEDIDTQLEQIRVCAEIGMQCIECDPEKRPQSTQYIIDRLEEAEPAVSVAQMSPSMCTERGLLAVHDCQLRFPLFKPDEPISCPLRLTNNTSDHIAFRCFQKLPESFIDGLSKLHGIVPRRSTRTLFVFMKKQPPESLEAFDVILESCVAHKDIGDVEDHFSPIFRNLLGGKVHQVPLQALCHLAGDMPIQSRTKIICNIHPAERLATMDVHPVKPWILVGHYGTGYISIWNYETGERMMKLNIIDDADQYFEKSVDFYNTRRAIFIAREHWIVVGDGHGVIHIRSCKTLELEGLKKFKAHNSMIGALGFHPTLPLLLSGCHEDNVINLWDWEKGWTCVAKFKHYGREGTEGLMFNPQNESPDNITFASATISGTVKIWNISSPFPIAILDCDGELLYCLNYFLPGGDRQYIVTGSASGNAHIWNLRTHKRVRKITGLHASHGNKVGVVNCSPDPPLLITSLKDYNIGLWDFTTSRYKNIFDFELGIVRYSVYINQIRSVVIGFEGGLAMVEID